MRIIVTGASGFVGRNLIDELLNNGHEVIALTNSGRKNEHFQNLGVKTIICSMAEYQKMDIPEEMAHSDIFFHFAWEGTAGPKRADLELQSKNVLAARDAVGLANRCGCSRFVFAGSIMEYEAIEYIGADLSEPPLSYIYGCSKLAGNQVAKIEAQQLGLEYVALIISNIFGAGEESPRFLNTIIRKMTRNEDIALTDGIQQYDFIYITDAVRAIYLAGVYGISKCIYYIGNTEQKALREFVEEAKECVGSRSRLTFGAIPYFGVRSVYRRLDTKKLEREFHFKPNITFQEGIKKILSC